MFNIKSDDYQILYKSWLIACMSLVIIMLTLGGYTRLTGSGLSITQWDLFNGILPPLGHHEWQILFNKYKTIPQFTIINFAMDLDGFKKIFWLEYIHRLFGRITGITIILPALFFLKYKSDINRKFIITIIVLILLQGCLGWFMVASGLKENITVSHFRLAAHLMVAFFIFALFVNHIIHQNRVDSEVNNKTYYIIKILFIMLTIQVCYGAFVAGLDAGFIYNDFPLMGNSFYPGEIFEINILQILFYNPATVQFLHRIFAYIIIMLNIILLFNIFIAKYSNIIKLFTLSISLLTLLQVILGIITILTVVNIHIAVLHQLCGIILYSMIFSLFKLIKLKNH